ncbi:hypothetical protein Tco_1346103 [Tanacetum coccineum]
MNASRFHWTKSTLMKSSISLEEPVEIMDREVKAFESKVASFQSGRSIGILKEVPSIPGNAKTKCRRSTLICLLTLHPHLKLRPKL